MDALRQSAKLSAATGQQTRRKLADEGELTMALEAYQAKRNFKVTPEPRGSRRGSKSATSAALRFVIQKHDATRLHY